MPIALVFLPRLGPTKCPSLKMAPKVVAPAQAPIPAQVYPAPIPVPQVQLESPQLLLFFSPTFLVQLGPTRSLSQNLAPEVVVVAFVELQRLTNNQQATLSPAEAAEAAAE